MQLPKPRLAIRNNVWTCFDYEVVYPKTGGRLYLPLGIGKTPKEAWDNAFPKSWWQKLKEAFRI